MCYHPRFLCLQYPMVLPFRPSAFAQVFLHYEFLCIPVLDTFYYAPGTRAGALLNIHLSRWLLPLSLTSFPKLLFSFELPFPYWLYPSINQAWVVFVFVTPPKSHCCKVGRRQHGDQEYCKEALRVPYTILPLGSGGAQLRGTVFIL